VAVDVKEAPVPIDRVERIVDALQDLRAARFAGSLGLFEPVAFFAVEMGADLARDRLAQRAQRLDIVFGPVARCAIHRADGAKNVAVRPEQRDAEIGDGGQLAHGEGVAHQRVDARVGDDEGDGAGDHVLTDRMRQRALARAHPGLRQAVRAHEGLSIRRDQRDQRRRRLEQPAGEPRQSIERLPAGDQLGRA
jgi:hypothetical protein